MNAQSTRTSRGRAAWWGVMFVLALTGFLCSCGEPDGEQLCSSSADCADDERCVSSGGVFFGDRICVLDDLGDQEDAGSQDDAEQEEDDKRGPPWQRDD